MAIGLESYLAPLLLLVLVLLAPSAISIRAAASRIVFYLPIEFAIAVAQVLSSPASAINKQVVESSTQFVNAGVARAVGTFTSPESFVFFLTLVLVILISSVVEGSVYRRGAASIILLVLVMLSVVISGSRGALVNAALVLVLLMYVAIARGGTGRRIASGILVIVVGVALTAIGIFAVFGNVFQSFLIRITEASQAENSASRVIEQSFGFFSAPLSLLGDGIGAHTQAGIALGSPALWVERESTRWVAELGLTGMVLACLNLIIVAVLLGRVLFGARAQSLLVVLLSGALAWMLLAGHIGATPSSQGAVGLMTLCLYLAIQDMRKTTRDDRTSAPSVYAVWMDESRTPNAKRTN